MPDRQPQRHRRCDECFGEVAPGVEARQLELPQKSVAERPPAQDRPDDFVASKGSTSSPAIVQAPDIDVAVGLAVGAAEMVARASDDGQMTCFHAVRAPNISIRDYVARVFKYFACSGPCCVLALVYLDRLLQRNPKITMTHLSVHRLLFVSMLVAAKFHDDVFYSNAYYAKIGGLQLKEVNHLEARFVKLLDWKLQVRAEEFCAYQNLCVKLAHGQRAKEQQRFA